MNLRRSTTLDADTNLEAERPSEDDIKRCAPVLDRMVDIIGADSETTFGAALERASQELGITVPEHMHGPLLTLAMRIVVNKRIPGAPDA